jgi:hypothetical protein
MGWPAHANQRFNLEASAYSVEEIEAIAVRLGMDNIPYVLRAPVYADKVPGEDGIAMSEAIQRYGRYPVQEDRP